MHAALNTASFAFRQVNYHATGDWGQACRTSREHFAPLDTFHARFDGLMREVQDLGFARVELWHFHLHQRWWTPEHVAAALDVLRSRHLSLVAFCGTLGDDLPEVERTLQLMNALGVTVFAGGTRVFREQRQDVVALLRHHGVRFAYENHPERTPAEVLDLIGDDEDGHVGVTLETGWFGTQGYPANDAARELARRILHVHLKDVAHVGTPHETCAFGAGVVPLRAVIEELRAQGYAGAVSVEHEPEQHDPTEDLRAARRALAGWLEGAS